MFIEYASHHSIEPIQKDSLLCLYRIQEVRCDLTVIDSFHSIYEGVPLGGIFLICGQIGHLVRDIKRIYSSLFGKGRKVHKLFAPIGEPKVHVVGNVSSHSKFRVGVPETELEVNDEPSFFQQCNQIVDLSIRQSYICVAVKDYSIWAPTFANLYIEMDANVVDIHFG